jgi:hypothetical protein
MQFAEVFTLTAARVPNPRGEAMRIQSVAPLAAAALAGAMTLLAFSTPQAAAVAQGSGQAKPKSPAPQHLEMADARRVARKVAREFARSDDRVTTAVVGECKRRSERHVDCFAVDQGESSTTKTVCHLRVSIRARDGSQGAKLASSQCRTTSLLTLTEADALAAMTETLREVTGRPVQIPAISRISQASFAGLGEWTRTGSSGGQQKCSAILTATRKSLNLVSASIDLPDCRPPQSGTQPPPKGGGPIY